MTDELMRELRIHFQESSASRLVEMRELLHALAENHDDQEALARLSRHFHALSGLGATYGYPAISELGDLAEGTSLSLVRRGEAPSGEQISEWVSVVEKIAAELQS